MEEELQNFKKSDGTAYMLVPLPMCEAKHNTEGKRLPATYANFLITNDALIFPTYNDSKNDKQAEALFRDLFPGREVIPVNCMKLIEEGGSLHCSTMQVAY